MVANCAIISLLERPVLDFALLELLLIIVAAGIMIATAVTGGSIVVAFYLLLCGLPMAALLGRHIAHFAALGVAALDALLAAAFAVSESILDPSYESGFP